MMMKRLFLPVLLTGLLLGGCASEPPRLVVLPAAPAASPVAAQPARLLLRPLRVPGYLDNLPVVTQVQGGRVTQAAQVEWAERLSDGAARVLSGALASRLGPGNLLIEGDGRIPDADLSIDLTALDPQADGTLRLAARWTLVGTRGERPVRAGQEDFSVPLASGDPADIAASITTALARLADRLAAEAATFPLR